MYTLKHLKFISKNSNLYRRGALKNRCNLRGFSIRLQWLFFVLLCVIILENPAYAYEVNDKFSVNALILGAFQYGVFENNFDDNGRRIADQGNGAFGIDLEFDYSPTEFDTFYSLWQFYLGNSLNNTWMGPLQPFGHFLEDTIRNINGRRRDYLLEAWYKHTFTLGESRTFGITGGLIDSTIYIDDNAYANDETTQFMNCAFINDPINNLPSYDWGTSLEFDDGPYNFTFVALTSRTNDDDNRDYQIYTAQLRYTVENALGTGNYRIIGFTTNSRFPNPERDSLEPLQGFGVSLDQQLTDYTGVFLRSYYQNDRAEINYQWDINGGLSISGGVWSRINDEIGIAYGYLAGGNSGIKNVHVFEAYARFEICPFAEVTLDIQFMKDNLVEAPTRSTWIPGLRFAAYF